VHPIYHIRVFIFIWGNRSFKENNQFCQGSKVILKYTGWKYNQTDGLDRQSINNENPAYVHVW
jgi:hypothetical protein